MNKIPKITIELSTTTLALMVVVLVFGYLLGNTFPITGKTVLGQSTTQQPAQQTQPSQPARVQVDIANEPSLGNGNAKVLMVEFTDFQCPFCKRAFDTTFPLVKKEYIDTGKVKYVVKDFPLPFHTEADEAAEAANCAFDQGTAKYWEMHDLLFNKQNEWAGNSNPKAIFKTYGKDIGLNTAAFDSCLDSGKQQQEIQQDIKEGSTAGVSGTPTFYINGLEVVGAQPYSIFKQVVDAELAS